MAEENDNEHENAYLSDESSEEEGENAEVTFPAFDLDDPDVQRVVQLKAAEFYDYYTEKWPVDLRYGYPINTEEARALAEIFLLCGFVNTLVEYETMQIGNIVRFLKYQYSSTWIGKMAPTLTYERYAPGLGFPGDYCIPAAISKLKRLESLHIDSRVKKVAPELALCSSLRQMTLNEYTRIHEDGCFPFPTNLEVLNVVNPTQDSFAWLVETLKNRNPTAIAGETSSFRDSLRTLSFIDFQLAEEDFERVISEVLPNLPNLTELNLYGIHTISSIARRLWSTKCHLPFPSGLKTLTMGTSFSDQHVIIEHNNSKLEPFDCLLDAMPMVSNVGRVSNLHIKTVHRVVLNHAGRGR